MRFFANLHQLSDWGLLALRIGVGMSFWAHGTAKRTMWKMAPSPQMPAGFLLKPRPLFVVEAPGGAGAVARLLLQPRAAGVVIILVWAVRPQCLEMDPADC